MPFEPSLVPDNPLWETFHQSTRWGPADWEEVARRVRACRRPPEAAPWHSARRRFLALPDPGAGAYLASSLGSTLLARRSAREFSGAPLEWREIATALWATSGCLPAGEPLPYRRRLAPSAGARYPIETFLWLPVPPEGTGPGPYHYDPLRHGLTEVFTGRAPPLEALLGACAFPALVQRSGLLIVLAAAFARTTAVYGGRGYRFVLIEAGHAAQNTYLAGAALGLGVVALGGWDDPALDSMLGLDGRSAGSVYAVALGRIGQDWEHAAASGGPAVGR